MPSTAASMPLDVPGIMAPAVPLMSAVALPAMAVIRRNFMRISLSL